MLGRRLVWAVLWVVSAGLGWLAASALRPRERAVEFFPSIHSKSLGDEEIGMPTLGEYGTTQDHFGGESRKGISKQSASKLALDIYSAYVEPSRIKRKVKWEAIAKHLDELDEGMTRYFIEFYEISKVNGRCDEIALRLALLCGGDELRSWIVVRLSEISIENAELETFKLAIGGLVKGVPSLDSVPMDDKLHYVGDSLIKSFSALDRVAGAGILGSSTTQEAQDNLQRLLENDQDVRVKAAAAKALGRMGDGAMALYLNRYLDIWRSTSHITKDTEILFDSLQEALLTIEIKIIKSKVR